VASDIYQRAFETAGAAKWQLTPDAFRAALDVAIDHAFGEREARPDDVARLIGSLHLGDLALASACAAGHEGAWEHFVREYRPALYRAADAIDPTGGARDLADALYADLYGVRERHDDRRSLFHYFHGRSRLATWLRAVLAQRHVDRVRAARSHDPLPDDDGAVVEPKLRAAEPAHPEHPRFVALMRPALADAIAALDPRDRLRLSLYYAQGMTLAAIGRLLHEHEATVSRHLARARRAIRDDVAARLRRGGLDDAGVDECFQAVASDVGPIDLGDLLGEAADGTPAGSAAEAGKIPRP
jgi:RNA polymerase sigma factor (sigma-70 family)